MSAHILIIDDEAYIRDLYEEVLKTEGYTVTVASDGESGLTKLSDGGYDAVLLDVMMPKIDGLGVLAKLKEITPKKPNGPIIILTNLDDDPLLKKAIALGAYTYLLKSDILPPKLIQAVNEAIKKFSTSHSQPGQ